MCLTGWRNCDGVMGLLEPQAILSRQSWIEGDGHSYSKKCLLDMLRCEQISSDHQDGMRGRAECHQHRIDMKSHVSEWQSLLMPCRQRREVVQTEPWGTRVVRCCDLDTSPLQNILKDLSERQDSKHWSAVPEISFANRVDRRIWWFTVSKAADRSKKIIIEDVESALASLRASTTESKADSWLNVHFWNQTGCCWGGCSEKDRDKKKQSKEKQQRT